MLLNIDNKLTDSYYEASVKRSAASPALAGNVLCVLLRQTRESNPNTLRRQAWGLGRRAR